MSSGTGDRFGLKLCEDLSDACVVDKQPKQRERERESRRVQTKATLKATPRQVCCVVKRDMRWGKQQ